RAREEVAQEATELLNEFGKDAYWVACACARRASGALGRHWEEVILEIERRTGRGSPGTAGTVPPRKAVGNATPPRTVGSSLRAPLDQLAPRSVHFTRLGAYHAGTPDDRYEEHSYGRDQYASQMAATGFDRHQEDQPQEGWYQDDLAGYDHADDSDRAV